VHYLADDDLFVPDRFAIFDALFADPRVVVGYGQLVYIDRAEEPTGKTQYFETLDDPFCVLDQNQVAHRRLVFDDIPAWPEVDHFASDGGFFRTMSRRWPFRGIERVVGRKRLHDIS